MNSFLLVAVFRVSLLPALLVNPWLLARLLSVPRPDAIRTAALTGFFAFLLNSAVPVLLHLLAVPIHGASLSATHAILFAFLAPATVLRIRWNAKDRDTPEPHGSGIPRSLLFLAGVFAVLVFPFTGLAGIDTYKWLDLAGAVQVDSSIPWFIHPLSLAGFTPRSYPSIQPLTLATCRILGGLGVDGGYYLISLLSGLTGLFASAALGRRLFPGAREPIGYAALYVFSPVFMRYNHWATGRGVFLAILPLFLLSCLDLPRWKAWLLLCTTAIALPLSHKAGIVAVPLVLLSIPLSFALPRLDRRWFRILLLTACLVGALLLAGPLSAMPGAFLRRAITRFGWYLPVAAIAALWLREEWTRPAWRRLFPAALLTFPLAFHGEMYGALAALPFVCQFTAAGVTAFIARRPGQRHWIVTSAAALTALAALAIVIHRSWTATPRPLRRAALFLERYDPLGPFRVDAPEPARSQVQGYCSGCPRFEVMPPGESSVRVRPPPSLRGNPRGVAQAWINYLRHALSAGDAGIAWYGRNPRLYLIRISPDSGSRKGFRVLYEEDGVAVLAPADQPAPPAKPREEFPWRRK